MSHPIRARVPRGKAQRIEEVTYDARLYLGRRFAIQHARTRVVGRLAPHRRFGPRPPSDRPIDYGAMTGQEPDRQPRAPSPRRLASIGLFSAFIGAGVAVLIAVQRGGGLASTGYLGYLTTYLLGPPILILIAVGAGMAIIGRRPAGVTLMLAAALFQTGYSIGQLATIWLAIPRSN